jgi:hypothetical protein
LVIEACLGVERKEVPENDTRVTITLSARAHEEMTLVAQQKGISLSKHLGQIIEQTHETPAYGNIVKRARCWLKGETYEGGYKGD